MNLDLDLDTVLVAGVNTRPVVQSAKEFGLRVIAVDIFEDVDLKRSADVLLVAGSDEFKETNFEEGGYPDLFGLSFEALECYDIDAVLLSSGMEHDFRLLKEIEKKTKLIGNLPEKIFQCSKEDFIARQAEKLNIPHPRTEHVKSEEGAKGAATSIGYPVVLKSSHHGGGIGVRIAKNRSELSTEFEELQSKDGGIYVQDFIRGTNASASVISTGLEARCLSVNRQLIGEERLGVPRRFGFCGNIVPLDEGKKIIDRISNYSERICRELSLVGSNGVDYVISNGKPYLIEVNPRFQSTLDLVERLLDVNMVREHLRAFQGEVGSYISPTDCGIKLILYAKRDTKVPYLGKFEGIADIPSPESFVQQGDPLCSIRKFGRNRNGVIEESYQLADRVRMYCQG